MSEYEITVVDGDEITVNVVEPSTIDITVSEADVFNVEMSNLQGPQGPEGPAGPSSSLSIGTVAGGDVASATITGTSPSQELNLVLPKGDPGPQGMNGFPAGFQYFGVADRSDSDPGPGCYKVNSNLFDNVTMIYLSSIDQFGNSRAPWIESLGISSNSTSKAYLTLVGRLGQSPVIYRITGQPIPSSGYYKVPVDGVITQAYPGVPTVDAGPDNPTFFQFSITGDQGEPGPPGMPGPAATPVISNSYIHTQNTPSSTWVIEHNLFFYPQVSVLEIGGSMVEGHVTYDSINQLTITFSVSIAGTAYLS